MRPVQPVKLLVALCASAFIWSSCQKETSTSNPVKQSEETNAKLTGFVFDNPELVRHVPILMSAEYAGQGFSAAARGKDTDRDGIPDSRDQCITSQETYNGYQDTDGCPDTVPAPSDADADGITDANDACPSQPETYNGYQDTDGCPDTVPPPTDTIIINPPSLPSSYQLTMQSVGNQGGEFSCVAWAVSMARSAEKYYATGATGYNYSTNIFSPEFLYNQVKFSADCSSGTGIFTALNFVKNQGICTWQTMPYSSTNGCSLLPTSTQTAEAANHKILSFSQVSMSDQTAIKTLLTQKHPLIAGTSVDDSFVNATAGFTWSTFTSSFGTNHGYVICGYDDARHAYKVVNSWGTTWADNGYSWIDYDFFGTLPGSLYVITSAN